MTIVLALGIAVLVGIGRLIRQQIEQIEHMEVVAPIRQV